MSTISSLKCGLFAVASLLASSASAQLTLSLHATTQSWYDSNGDHGLSTANFITLSSTDGYAANNFFVFDRTELKFAHVYKATLEISLPAELFAQGDTYFSSDVNDTGALFSLYKYEGDIDALLDSSGGVAAFDDLGSDVGGTFGSRGVSVANNVPDSVFSVDLTEYFLSYINGLDGRFALGGALSNPSDTPAPGDFEYMFAFTQNSPMATLRLEYAAVPEPSTYGLIGAAALGLLVWRRRSVNSSRKN